MELLISLIRFTNFETIERVEVVNHFKVSWKCSGRVFLVSLPFDAFARFLLRSYSYIVALAFFFFFFSL